MCERDSVITPVPASAATPRSAAAWRALARTNSGKPARSASSRSTSPYSDSSASTFCENRVVRSASRCITCA